MSNSVAPDGERSGSSSHCTIAPSEMASITDATSLAHSAGNPGTATTTTRPMVYLNAVINETLRVRPVILDVTRRVTRPTTVAGHRLPAGVMVDPAILLVHRSPENYDDPQRFDPGRYGGGSPDPSVWLSFGGGNRRCIGATFAATEMRIVLREILRRVELEPTDAPDEPAKVRHVTLIPKKQARIRLARRLSPAGERTPLTDEAIATSSR